MYFPPDFDVKKAIELGKLVKQAYEQFQFHKEDKEWKLSGTYNLVGTIIYNRWQMGFDVNEAESHTLIDDEVDTIQAESLATGDVSFGIVSDLFKDYPMGFIATSKNGKDAYLIFRGTVTGQEFIKDAKIVLTPYMQPNSGYVALGFLEVYTACRESFIKTLAGLGPDVNLYIAGHSLGAALSVLSLPDVAKATQFKTPTLYNFGCPRVGDNDFVTAYNGVLGQKTFRIANSSDLVTTLPPPAPIYYSHVDVPVDFNVQSNNVAINHSMDTYIAALAA